MKKVLSIAVVAIAVVFIGGCSVNKNDDNKQQLDQLVNKSDSSEKDDGMMGGMIDQLAKIKKGESMKCVYTIDMGNGEVKTESYVQGEKFKSITTMDVGEEMKTYAIFDGKNQYSWVEGKTEGFKMSMDCMDDMGDLYGEMDETEDEDSNEVMEIDDMFENAMDIDCQPVGKIDFTIPSNITFVDQCEMMKDQMKQIEELGGALPAGFEIPVEME